MPKRTRYATETGRKPSRVGRLKAQQTAHRRASRNKSRNALVSVPRNKMGFPQSMRTSLRYCDSFDIHPTSSTPVVKTFRANGLYDPDGSTGGHQPRGFDQFCDVFKKYTVKNAKISVVFTYEGYNHPVGTDSTGNPLQQITAQASAQVPAVPAVIGMVRPSVQSSPASGNIWLQQEIDKSKWITFTPHSGPASVSHRTGVVDFFGKDFLVGADGYTGTSGSDPTNQVYFHIMTGLQHNNYSVGPVQVRANVTITYDVVWTEPKPLPAS